MGCLIFVIGLARLGERPDLNDYLINSIKDIFVGYRFSDELIRSSILNILIDAFHLEVHHLWIWGYRGQYKGGGFIVIVENSFEQCIWMDVHG